MQPEGPPHVVVFVTTGNVANAEQLAETLVTEALAACVNIVGPIRSVYVWEGALQRDQEYLLIVKTRGACFDALADRVRQLHAYTTPEIIALPIVAGSAPYLQWVDAATRRG